MTYNAAAVYLSDGQAVIISMEQLIMMLITY